MRASTWGIEMKNYLYTIVCFGAEIGFGESESFEQAKAQAEAEAKESNASGWYPPEQWGSIMLHPTGMRITYNT